MVFFFFTPTVGSGWREKGAGAWGGTLCLSLNPPISRHLLWLLPSACGGAWRARLEGTSDAGLVAWSRLGRSLNYEKPWSAAAVSSPDSFPSLPLAQKNAEIHDPQSRYRAARQNHVINFPTRQRISNPGHHRPRHRPRHSPRKDLNQHECGLPDCQGSGRVAWEGGPRRVRAGLLPRVDASTRPTKRSAPSAQLHPSRHGSKAQALCRAALGAAVGRAGPGLPATRANDG